MQNEWLRSFRRTLRSVPPTLTQRRWLASSNRSTSSIPPQLIGSAPQYTRHLVLHAPVTSDRWPTRIEAVSPLLRQLGLEKDRFKGLGFSFAEASSTAGDADDRIRSWENVEEGEESYSGFIYPDHIPIPPLSLSTMDAFKELYATLPPLETTSTSSSEASTSTHIYVCTHTTRDCRCGEIGEPLYAALKKEVKRRGIDAERIKISRIAHVGGHVYAGNALVYRQGVAADWYGLLRASDASLLINHALSPSPDPLYELWRGRLNTPATEIKERYSAFMESNESTTTAKKHVKERLRKPLGEEVDLIFVDYEGEETKVVSFEGESIMDAAKRADLEAILATCGGHCECATCHCHIDPFVPDLALTPSATGRTPIALPTLPSLPPVSDEEEDQLSFALGVDDNSRLACQIPVTKEVGEWIAKGGRIRLPEY